MNMSKAFFEIVKHVLAAYGRLLLLTLQKRCRERGGEEQDEGGGRSNSMGRKGERRGGGRDLPAFVETGRGDFWGKKSFCYLLQSRDGRGHPRGTHHLHRFHKLLEGLLLQARYVVLIYSSPE